MRLNSKLEKNLRSHIDFSSFRLFELILGCKGGCITLLAPRKPHSQNVHFNMQYQGESYWYGSMEQMLDMCVHNGYISSFRAKLLIRRYNKFKGE